MTERPPVPKQFAQVVEFANTNAYLGHDDDLVDLKAARRTMRKLALPLPRDDEELVALRSVRHALRSYIADPTPAAIRSLNGYLRANPVSVVIGGGPTIGFTASNSAVSTLLKVICFALAEPNWNRLHRCANVDECGVIFFDSSRSRQGRWCTAQLCGNRINSRIHRDRLAGRGVEQRQGD